MVLSIPKNNYRVAYVTEASPREIERFKHHLTVQELKWKPCFVNGIMKNMPSYKDTPYWGYDKYYKKYFVPLGLVNKAYLLLKKEGIDLSVSNVASLKGYQVSQKEINDFYDNFLHIPDDFHRYDWQLEAVRQMLNAKVSSAEVSVSGGKTFLSFFIMRYIAEYPERFKIEKNKPNFMVIVPQTNLAEQNYLEYTGFDKDKIFQIQALYDKSPYLKENANITVTSFQTGAKQSQDWYDSFDAVIVDEMQFAKAQSIKHMINSCRNAKFITGMTGTYPDITLNEVDYHEIMSFLGSKIKPAISLHFLQSIGQTTPIQIYQHQIKYDYEIDEYGETLRDEDIKFTGSAGLVFEKEIAQNEINRINYIIEQIDKCRESTEMNHMVSFINKAIGKMWYSILVEKYGEENVYFINGEVSKTKKNNKRLERLQAFESGRKKILVGSIGTMSIGVNTKTIESIHAVEARKIFYSVVQLIGRQSRKHGEKGHAYFYDYVDIIKTPKGTRNIKKYLKSHGVERLKIYEKEKQPYEIIQKTFSKTMGRKDYSEYANLKI